MLEKYFLKPETLDRVRNCWLGEPIEKYVVWMTEQGFAPSSVRRRVPVLTRFAGFAHEAGVDNFEDLSGLVEGFVEDWVRTRRRKGRTKEAKRHIANVARVPLQQMLTLLLPDYERPRAAPPPIPFADTAPGFFDFLRRERGLQPTSLALYRSNLRRLERFLQRIGLDDIAALCPAVPGLLRAAVHRQRDGHVQEHRLGPVVAHQRAPQAALHERLAQPVHEHLRGFGQVPPQVAAQPRVIVQEPQQDGRLPLPGGDQHTARAVVEVGMPQRMAARDLVAEHLAGCHRRRVPVPAAPAAALSDQPAVAHRPGQRGVGGHRPERRIGLGPRGQVLVVQLRRPRRMRPVLLAQRLHQQRRDRAFPPGIGARAALQRPNRIVLRRTRLVVPALDSGDREAHRSAPGGVFPLASGEPPKHFLRTAPARHAARAVRSRA